MNSFESTGVWWLPDKPDKKISGTLKFDPVDGASLGLIGSFKEALNLGNMQELDVILGVTANSKLVTLYGCVESNTHFGVPGFTSSSFYVGMVFVGYHFGKGEDIVFDSLSVSYSYLEDWTRITGFRPGLKFDKKNGLDKYELTYSYPDKVEIKLDGFDLSFDYSFREGGDRLKKVEVFHDTFLKVQPKSALHFDVYYRDILYHLQNFLSLAIGKPVYPLGIKGKNSNCKTVLSGGKEVFNDILVYYRLRKLPDLSKTLHPRDMFFCYGDIASDFEGCLSNWFSKADVLAPVYDLYFATLYGSEMYLQHEFLSLVQAVESYHRRVFGGQYVDESAYKSVYDALVQAIPEKTDSGFKASMRQRMKYLHEFSLRKRLGEIVEKCGDVFVPVIPSIPVFVESVVDTRNFLTHYDKSLESKAKKGNGLYKITKQLKFLLEICLLIELGVSEANIKALV